MSLSTTQSSDILEALKQLKSEVTESHKTPVSADDGGKATEISDETKFGNNAWETQNMGEALEESISRLVKLVDEKECTVPSDDVEQLISDLQTLLDTALQKDSMSIHSNAIVNPYGFCRSVRVPEVSKELKLTNSLLFSAPSIKINSNGMIYSS